MRMKRVRDSRFQVVARKRGAQSRHVKIGLLEIAAQPFSAGGFLLLIFLLLLLSASGSDQAENEQDEE